MPKIRAKIRALLCTVWAVADLPYRSSGSQTWSNITLATCDETDPAQICTSESWQLLACLVRPRRSITVADLHRAYFATGSLSPSVTIDGTTIVDKYTGRCLTIWGCTDTENAVITADTCGGGCASSNSEGQAWDIHSAGSLLIKSAISKGARCIDASKSHSAGEPPVVTHTCGLVLTSVWP
jgi:hypothetical protein